MSNSPHSRLKNSRQLTGGSASRRVAGLTGARKINAQSSDFEDIAFAKKYQRLRIIRLILRLVLLLGLLSLLIFCFIFWRVALALPAPNQVVRQSGFDNKIYDRHGELLYDFFTDQRREAFSLSEVGTHLINATIAVEDKDFYQHKGFDFLTLVRIPYYYLTQGRLVGGSTLTQQLTKMMLLTNERTAIRKFRELILSMQIENLYSKEKILEMYLNEAPYGGNLHGANLAARNYFNKPMNQLSVAQAAMIAGLPQSPARYSPFSGRVSDEGEPLWQVRTKGVLRRMREDGYIGVQDEQDAIAELATFEFSKMRELGKIKAPHFVFYVEDQLREMLGDELVNAGGLAVHTSLDYALQASSEAIVKQEIEKVANMGISNGALLVLEPSSGEILAMVGSRDFFDQEIDGQFNVTAHPQALRQPGSSIKPLVYLALLMNKAASAATVFADVPTTFAQNEKITPYQPKNYDGKFRGLVSLRESLGNSYNIPAVKALTYVGVENFLHFAYNAGLSTFEPSAANLQRFGPAIALGGAEVKMLEMASAYASFANGGYKVQPVSILQIDNMKGQNIYRQQKVKGQQIFAEGETFIINHILSDNAARSIAFGTNSLLNTKKPIAVKTGTTNSMKDNWTIGWNSNFLVHVWVGNNDGMPMKSVASGITGASPIWRRTVDHLIALGYQTPDWVQPSSVSKHLVDAISGYPAHDNYPTKEEYFAANTLPTLPDPIHQKIAVCKGENKIATPAQLASGEHEEKEFIVMKEDDPFSQDEINRFQAGIDAWRQNQEDARYHYPTESCGSQDDVSVRIYDLPNETEITTIKFRVRADSGKGIDKVEVFLNNQKKEEFANYDQSFEWTLDKGVYEVKAKAFSRDGKEAESPVYKIGVGGAKVED